jgi:hypothetical protein
MEFHYFSVNQQNNSMSMSGSGERVSDPATNHGDNSAVQQNNPVSMSGSGERVSDPATNHGDNVAVQQNRSSLKRSNQSEGILLQSLL